MKLSDDDRARIRAVKGSNDTSFARLMELSGLKPALDLVAADLRNVDFGKMSLRDYDLRGARLEGADMSRARDIDPAMLEGARTDDRTRGFVVRDFPEGPEMVAIPPGTFAMGVPEAENEREGRLDSNARPVHEVSIPRGLLIGRYPVTRGEYAAFARATKRAARPEPGFAQDDRHPVVNVSHDDARAYAAWASQRSGRAYRLPSEAEWEYAARAGTATARYWGDAWDKVAGGTDPGDRGADHAHARAKGTAAVGHRLANGFGLHDMLGNVWEWCADEWHDDYIGAPRDGSAWTTTGSDVRRVLRGGSWNDVPGSVRAGCRYVIDVGLRDNYAGFRLARTSF